MRRLAITLVLAAAALGITEVLTIQKVTLANRTISVEIADSPSEWERGLSGRKSLASNAGMLFVFEKPVRIPFWMKDMHFAIDIIWISEQQRVVEIHHSLTPATYPNKFASPVPIKYVLEVNAGWAARSGLKVGDLVEI